MITADSKQAYVSKGAGSIWQGVLLSVVCASSLNMAKLLPLVSLEKDKDVVGLGTAEYGFLTSLGLSLYAEVYNESKKMQNITSTASTYCNVWGKKNLQLKACFFCFFFFDM